MNKQLKFETERLNINVPTKLIEKVNEYAINHGLPKTQAVIQLLHKALEEDVALETLKKALLVIEQNNDKANK